jgi:hypothetical protein
VVTNTVTKRVDRNVTIDVIICGFPRTIGTKGTPETC